MIIIAGQNIFPEDVEAVVNSVPGIYPGRVVSFGMLDQEYGTETIAVVAEAKGAQDPGGVQSLEKQIRSLVLATIGIAPRYVAVVPERWIIKSTAGKISPWSDYGMEPGGDSCFGESCTVPTWFCIESGNR